MTGSAGLFGSKFPKGARQVTRWILPEGIYDFLRETVYGYTNRHGADPCRLYPSRRDVEVLTVEAGVELMVYWKAVPAGTGPALSLFVHGSELAKFDFFGAGSGHYHIEQRAPVSTTQDRLYFFEQTIPQQIARAVFELEHNLQYYMQRHFRNRVRRTNIDPCKLRSALDRAVTMLESYQHRAA